MTDNRHDRGSLEDCVVAAIETSAKRRESPVQSDRGAHKEKNFDEQTAANGDSASS
jgi:hypothetical protein